MPQHTPTFLGIIGAFLTVAALSLALNTEGMALVCAVVGGAFLIVAAVLWRPVP
jgi:uncharacterized membrane protein YeaQ/YmgE (transglycosylase-associated protein family)